VLIIPSSWGSQLGAYHAPSSIFLAPLPGIEEEEAPMSTMRQQHFCGAVAREKEDFCKGSLSLPIFYFVIVLLTFFTLFLLASFYRKYKKIVSFIVGISLLLLLVHYVVP
jgi:hypothetical protein